MTPPRTLRVEIPSPDEDRPRFVRVSLIALAGFAAGIAWPWLTGHRLAPAAPTEPPDPVAEARAEPSAAPATTPEPSRPANIPVSKLVAEPRRVKVGKPKVTSCRTAAGEKASPCGELALEGVVTPQIEALQSCDASKRAQGVLSLGLRLDFNANRVVEFVKGQSTTLSDAAASELVACAKQQFAAVSLQGIARQHATYTVYYLIEFVPPSEVVTEDQATDAQSSDELIPTSGTATVAWVAAIIRDQPEKDGKEVSRLAAGTRVKVVARQGRWYRIQFGNEQGWVFKDAIGL